MEEPKQSTNSSTTGDSDGSTTTTYECTQQTTNVNETKSSHLTKLGSDGKKSKGTSGGLSGTHYESNSLLGQPTNINQTTTTTSETEETEAEGKKDGVAVSTTTTTTSKISQTITEETHETQVSSQPITVDGPHSGGTSGGQAGTHEYQTTS